MVHRTTQRIFPIAISYIFLGEGRYGQNRRRRHGSIKVILMGDALEEGEGVSRAGGQVAIFVTTNFNLKIDAYLFTLYRHIAWDIFKQKSLKISYSSEDIGNYSFFQCIIICFHINFSSVSFVSTIFKNV